VLAPYYDWVARDIGISGDASAEEIWRPAGEPYPMPPLTGFRHGEVMLKGFEANGIRMVPAALAINSTEYKGWPACIYDGWCHVGCPTGALANPLVTYLAEARKAGAEVRSRSTVTRVLTNAQGNRAIAIEYYDGKKQRQVQEASVVVLAAFAAANPRMLLNSANDKHPNGLANASGLVGKCITTHTGSPVWALFDEDMQNYIGVTATVGPTRYPTCMWQDPEFFRARGHRTPPTRCLLFRCAVPSNLQGTGARSRGDGTRIVLRSIRATRSESIESVPRSRAVPARSGR
jgi:choline dehydrogenase-like flavoprotein